MTSSAKETSKTMAISESFSPGPTLSPMSDHGGATALQNNDRSDNDDDEDDDESPGPDGNTGELKLFFPAPGSWKIRAPRRSIILHLPNNHPSLFPLSSHFDFPLSVFFFFFYIANIPKCSRPPSLLHFNFFSFFLIFQFCLFSLCFPFSFFFFYSCKEFSGLNSSLALTHSFSHSPNICTQSVPERKTDKEEEKKEEEEK